MIEQYLKYMRELQDKPLDNMPKKFDVNKTVEILAELSKELNYTETSILNKNKALYKILFIIEDLELDSKIDLTPLS